MEHFLKFLFAQEHGFPQRQLCQPALQLFWAPCSSRRSMLSESSIEVT